MKAAELQIFESKDNYLTIPTTIKHKIVVHESECTAIAFNPLGDMIATAGADQKVHVWNFETMQQQLSLSFKKNCNPCQLAFSFDNQHFMTASMDHKLNVYTIVANMLKSKFSVTAHKNIITSCKFLYTQNLVVSASLDKNMVFWDLRKGKQNQLINCK